MRNHQHLIGSRKQIIANSDGLLRLADAHPGTTRLEINEKMKIEIILAAIETAI